MEGGTEVAKAPPPPQKSPHSQQGLTPPSSQEDPDSPPQKKWMTGEKSKGGVIPFPLPMDLASVEEELKGARSEKDFLFKPKEGFGNPENLKLRMVGFSSDYQDYFFPLIDNQSGVLFEIVQEVEKAFAKKSEELLREYGQAVTIPPSKLATGLRGSGPGSGPEIKVRVMDPSEPLTLPTPSPTPATASTSTANANMGVAPASPVKQFTPAELKKIEKLITPANKAFSPEKLAKLMIPFSLGWKREIVIRSHGGSAKKLGDIYYFSPEGTKYRSSKQVALLLNRHPELELGAENFSFAKARVSYDPEQESVRGAQGGRGLNPVKNAQKERPANTNTNNDPTATEDGEDPAGAGGGVTRAGGRRSIQPPKRYAQADFVAPTPPKRTRTSAAANSNKELAGESGMEMGMLPPKYGEEFMKGGSVSVRGRGGGGYMKAYGAGPPRAQQQHANAGGEGSVLFGLSALTQQGYAQQPQGMVGGRPKMAKKGELLPCSIRCPGVGGDVPTLQCVRCLCLYHPECLDLPPTPTPNFLCSNCEDLGIPSGGQGQGQNEGGMMMSMGGRGGMCGGMRGGLTLNRRSEPPPLLHLRGGGATGSPAGRGRPILPKLPTFQTPGGRLIIPPRPPGTMMRGGMPGRGRPPSRPAITITPIQMGGPRPRGGGQGQGQPQGMRMMRGGGQMPNSPPRMTLLKRGGLAPAGRRPRGGGSRLGGLFRMDDAGRVMVAGVGGVGGGARLSSPQFQRYAQSVVTIDSKKYLALPKNSSAAAPPLTNSALTLTPDATPTTTPIKKPEEEEGEMKEEGKAEEKVDDEEEEEEEGGLNGDESGSGVKMEDQEGHEGQGQEEDEGQEPISHEEEGEEEPLEGDDPDLEGEEGMSSQSPPGDEAEATPVS